MKKLLSLFLLLAGLIQISAQTRADKIIGEINNPKSNYVLVALHRGDWRHFPENSLEGIESSIKMGGDIVEIEQKHGKMYAKKEGIIKSFDIESGKIVKEINDYVKVGDLLVDDTILYKDKAIVVGTLGRVMAYTFNNITFLFLCWHLLFLSI